MTATLTQRGRKEIFQKRDQLVQALRAIHKNTGENVTLPSRFLQMRLSEAGLIGFQDVKTGGCGRPQKVAYLTRDGLATMATI